jgi:hypothetical protein
MSVVDRPDEATEVPFEQLPTFQLECMYDDWDDPSSVTIFSTDDGDSLYTAWLTVDQDSAVPLTDVR